jgi:hypothetical protein
MTMTDGNDADRSARKGETVGERNGAANPDRRTSIIVGLLFITATVAGFVSAAFLGPIMTGDVYLEEVSANETSFLIGSLAIVAMGLAGAGIGISLYPVLRRYNEGLALGSAGFRVMEGTTFGVGAILLLRSLKISQLFVDAGSPDASYFQTLGELSVNGQDLAMVVGGLAFCVGAILYYYVFYQARLVPRWLAVFGLIAIVLSAAQTLMTFFAGGASSASEVEVLHLPIFVQEMILAVFLIVKGFDHPEASHKGED